MKNCEFTGLDFEIEQEIIIGEESSKIWRHALHDPNCNVSAMLINGRRDQISSYQSKDIEAKDATPAETHQLRQNREKGDLAQTYPQSSCWNCGGTCPHRGQCPAKGKLCNFCGNANHFSKVCKETRLQSFPNTENSTQKGKKPIHPLQLNQSTDSEMSDSEGDMYAIAKLSTSKTSKAIAAVCEYAFIIININNLFIIGKR